MHWHLIKAPHQVGDIQGEGVDLHAQCAQYHAGKVLLQSPPHQGGCRPRPNMSAPHGEAVQHAHQGGMAALVEDEAPQCIRDSCSTSADLAMDKNIRHVQVVEACDLGGGPAAVRLLSEECFRLTWALGPGSGGTTIWSSDVALPHVSEAPVKIASKRSSLRLPQKRKQKNVTEAVAAM